MSSSVRGRESSFAEAVGAAAALLGRARMPLVYGLLDSTVEAQREAVHLARRILGVIDPAASTPPPRSGELSTTLGEMRRQADLVVLWACDPERGHPGFLAAHAPATAGRTRLWVDLETPMPASAAPDRVSLPPAREVEGLLVLRTLVLGRRLDPTRVGSLDLGLEALRWLARRLRSADYAVIVRDGDPRAPGLPIRAELLNRLARDARRHARVRILTLRPGRNAAGAERVLTWLTGFPSAVSFAGGEPRHDPHLWGAEAALAGGAADAAVVVGADPAKWLSPAAQARLRSIPVVAVGWGPPEAEVFIEAEPLSSTPGHLFRMDGLVLRQAFQGTDLPTEAEVLRSITGAVAGEAAA